MPGSRIQRVFIVLATALTVASCAIRPGESSPDSSLPATSAAGGPTSTTIVDTATTTPSATTTTEILVLDDAIASFQKWVGALAAGETDRAWDLMAPSSQLALGSFERFDSMRTGFAEGWGSWVAAEDVSYSLEQDEAGRTLLIADGVIHPEGHTEQREVGVPLVIDQGRLLLSPFEEFGNVARGLDEESAGADPAPLPVDSGEGRRVVYSNSEQRVWMVESDGSIRDTYLVSGKKDVPAPGEYEVFSKSEVALAGHDDITMRHMVRFAHGRNLAIGFHAIPNDGNGRPLQSEEELGEYHSAGCVRQSPGHAAALYEWAEVGTAVVVLE